MTSSGVCSLRFWLGEESSVGQNSRLLLADGTIYWVGNRDDAVRPTGPFDPELPVMAFKRPDGGLEAPAEPLNPAPGSPPPTASPPPNGGGPDGSQYDGAT